jgi:CheY-like chemotaxis protein
MTYCEDLKKVSSTSEYLTRSQARRILAKNPEWNRLLHGDLQMHTVWSGFDAILLKPFTPDVLLQVISRAIQRRT